MLNLVISSAILSVLHSIIPNHWLSVLAIAKRQMWSLQKTLYVTLLAGLAHSFSTVLIGLIISLTGAGIEQYVEQFTTWVAPIILITLGIYFIWRHYRHHHFHLHRFNNATRTSSAGIVWLLALAMFFSPCLEFEGLYLLAIGEGWNAVILISIIYLVVSVTGMVIWVRLAYGGLERINWHKIEHYAGIISGVVLILTGTIFFFLK